jgi:hypothetical protein
MRTLSKNNWVPIEVALPDDYRIVLVQIAELPTPTIASYWADKGEWVHEEIGFKDFDTITVLAWRELPEAYQAREFNYEFRPATEAQIVTLEALKRIKSGKDNPEFFDIREEILHASTRGLFEIRRAFISSDMQKLLVNAGYRVARIGKEFLISWEEVENKGE